MKKLFLLMISFTILIASGLASSELAFAYSPSAYALVKKVVDQFKFETPVIAKLDSNTYTAEGKKLIYKASVAIKYPFALKVTMHFPGKKESSKYIVNHNDIVDINGDIITSFDRNNELIFFELFTFGDADAMLEYLKMINIDHSKITLGMDAGKTYYVIGSDQLKLKTNQLWIDKETNLPRYLVLYTGPVKEFSAKYEFSDYYLKEQFFFPWKIRYYSNDALALEFETKNIENSDKITDELFDTKKLRMKYKVNTTTQEFR